MKKKITALCSVMIVLSICVAMLDATNLGAENNVTTAAIKSYNAPKAEATTSNILNDIVGSLGGSSLDDIRGSLGDIGGSLGNIDGSGITDSLGGITDSLGGIGDAFGGVGDALGSVGNGISDSLGNIFGGSGSGSGSAVNTTAPATSSADIGLIIPVPAATQTATETQTTSVEASTEGETVDHTATSNPYTKPTSNFTAGDEDETIKWLQWIFIYTGYGLKEDGITGVLDSDTITVVKKLQNENQMTVDGNITEEVVKAAEVLYYKTILGGDVSAIEVPSDATTGVNPSDSSVDGSNGNSVPVALLVVVLVIIWVLAIGGIVLLFVFKKKKTNAAKKAAEEAKEKEKKASEENTDNKSGISSLSDLFEEAEKSDE